MVANSEKYDLGGLDLYVRRLITGSTKPGHADGSTVFDDSGVLLGDIDTRSGAGAISLDTLITLIATDGADAITLADGTAGQIKILIMTTDNGAGTVTPANFGSGSTATFDDVGDTSLLVFDGTNWYHIAGSATIA